MKFNLKFISIILAIISCISYTYVPVCAETDNKQGGTPVVLVKTNKGDITIELDREKAPISVDNFLSYVNDGYYNNTIFHRVIKGFMIQTGGKTQDFQQKETKAQIKNEANNGLKNVRGSVAMGRTSAVDSATSHFFINQVDNPFLDHGVRDYGYAVFGKVTQGMDIVDAIANVDTGRGDVPINAVVIESITLVD